MPQTEPMLYQAIAVRGVGPDVPRREIGIVFGGSIDDKECDLMVSLPAGCVGALVTGLYGACTRIDSQTRDVAAVMQPMPITGTDAINPIEGQCAILLRAGGFSLPAVLSKEVALATIASLKQAIAALEHPFPSRLS